MLAAVAVDGAGLDRAGADRGDRLEAVAFAGTYIRRMEQPDVFDQHVQFASAKPVDARVPARPPNAQVEQKAQFVAVVGQRARGSGAGTR